MDENLYYNGYEIVKPTYMLTLEEKKTLDACHWMVDNKSTIRETAINWCYSYTTLWRRIHRKCSKLSPELYKLMVKQMKENLERSRYNLSWKHKK